MEAVRIIRPALMQLAANQRLARNRARLGTGLNLASLVFLFGASLVSFNQQLLDEFAWVPWVGVVVGMGLFLIGQTQTKRWLPNQQQASMLQKAASGLDDRYKMYQFLSTSLPDFVLVGPGGVQVLVPRAEGGKVVCDHDRWTKGGGSFFLRFLEPGLGNPTRDAQGGLKRIQALLDTAGLSGVPMSAIIVFTHQNAQLRIDASSVPVTKLKDLREVLRRTAGKGTGVMLTLPRIREVQAVFDRRMEASRAWR